MDTHVDIFIAGAGIAGLTMAAACAHAGYSVLIADPKVSAVSPIKKDQRSTAFLQPARDLFEAIDLWDRISTKAQPLDALRIVVSAGDPPEVQATREFSPQDLESSSFGWNLPNWQTSQVLMDHLAAQPNVTLATGLGVSRLMTRNTEAFVTLSDQSQIRCQLILGADGRNSQIRQCLNIPVETARYGQFALAFTATHLHPHSNISTEVYNQGGAFTTVPLPDHQGLPHSAIVWMNDGPVAKHLAGLSAADFNAEMTIRACSLLGPMERTSPLQQWPVVTQKASTLVGERAALLAEAAHVLPPIGAQGLNTSLLDVRALYDLLKDRSHPLGSSGQLDAYEAARGRDIALRAKFVDLYNRICKSGQPAVQSLRRTGLTIAHDIAPLRLSIMRAGMGA